MAVERRDDGTGILAAERFAEDRRMAHVGRGYDLRHRHRDAHEIGIAHFAAAQNIGERMAQKFAHAQLALRGARFRIRTRACVRPPERPDFGLCTDE